MAVDASQSPTENEERTVRKHLGAAIRVALAVPKTPAIDREDMIAKALRDALPKVGRFFRVEDGGPVYVRNADHRVYEMTERPESEFGRLVTYLADVSVKGAILSRALHRLAAGVSESAPVIRLHATAFNNSDASVVAVNDFGGGMWFRRRNGSWEWKPNGSEGIYFWTPSGLVEPWKPEFSGDPETDEVHLRSFVAQPHFADDMLTASDQRLLLRALLIAPFFPARCRIRPVQAHLGLNHQRQHDTGKTMAGKMIGALIVGSKFEPMPPPLSSEKGQEALQLELMHSPYVLLDNVDTEVKWLNDLLCTYATGARATTRKYYTNTEQVSIPYRARLCVTSRKAKFNRPDVASRVIPFRFAPIGSDERLTEPELLDPVINQRGRIWAGILAVIARVQDALPQLAAPRPGLRLADFEKLGWCISAVFGEAEPWQAMIPRLRVAQAGFAVEGEGLVAVLRKLLENEDLAEQRTSEFYKQVRQTARDLELESEIPGDAATCTKRINELQEALEAVLEIKISVRTLHGHSLIQIQRGSTWAGVTKVTDESLSRVGGCEGQDAKKKCPDTVTPATRSIRHQGFGKPTILDAAAPSGPNDPYAMFDTPCAAPIEDVEEPHAA
jgi:hypothetical protein